MAKQTFTTGQVLTAAQMTSLQQTAMLGGAASAKVASYTLVAADAGTAITMSNASATTITVNTSLFAAGDIINITNIGAGTCTITAGTATVNTSASLALAQYESGTLEFISTSSAIFVKGAGAAAASGGMTLLSTTSLSGASTTLSSISGSYNNLQLVIQNALPSAQAAIVIRFNSDTGSNYVNADTSLAGTSTTYSETYNTIGADQHTSGTNLIIADIPNYANTSTRKLVKSLAINQNNGTPNFNLSSKRGSWNNTAAISSITILFYSGTISSGTALLYGVK
jgi:hypothetical protein